MSEPATTPIRRKPNSSIRRCAELVAAGADRVEGTLFGVDGEPAAGVVHAEYELATEIWETLSESHQALAKIRGRVRQDLAVRGTHHEQ